MRMIFVLALFILGACSEESPRKPYYLKTTCIKSHTETDWGYHWGYVFGSGFKFHFGYQCFGIHKKTVCDSLRTDKVWYKKKS